MTNNDYSNERSADYSIASEEERERVIDILLRNKKSMLKRKLVKDRQDFDALVDEYIRRIRNGDIIRGSDFENLLKLFRQRPM